MDQEQVNIKTPEFVSVQFQLAGLGSRASAFLIDQIILMAVNLLILLAAFVIVAGQPDLLFSIEMNTVPIAIAVIVVFIINWGYFFVFEYFSGGKTIGKKALGIRVIQDNGHSITLLSSFIRNLLRIIDSLPVNYLVGMLMIFFHSRHKRIGDLVGGTIVVHEGKKKTKKKGNSIEKEIKNRGLSKDDLILEDWTLGAKEWNLIKTYSNRYLQLSTWERTQLTKQVGGLLLPKVGMEVEGKTIRDIENTLFVIYLHLKDEWEFEW
ncbi:RDD family protein [Aquibacillus sp. 3ASR75-11]|uniref:RDD family protein n=1 Tax=Terrihalobacillus insolitus TaxID=2950438 RepID=A0A9X4AN15_9BACI|nr:RDD family protein [Terrihalobacillus insolitus]MDC3414173.1 RDD family protein [Terrihalobacillus insolitus]MDC3425379.1 RDD family protein [Terrihalobacillus insolitus]